MTEGRFDPSRPEISALMALNEAALAISSDLSLANTLQQIVESACRLAGARYAALGVFNSDGVLTDFFHTGLSEEEAARIERCPKGEGLLGALIEERSPIRRFDLASDPRSVGFPKGHPPMRSFLGVPILAGEATLGNLYLTDKLGEGEFSRQDESLIAILAAHAAVAIKNARLFQASLERGRELADRNRDLEALNTVARATSSFTDLDRTLASALDQVLNASGAAASEIYLASQASGELEFKLHRGSLPGEFYRQRSFRPGQGGPGRVLESSDTVTVEIPTERDAFLHSEVVAAGFRRIVSVPLRAKEEVVGSLELGFKNEDAGGAGMLRLLDAVGHQIGVAVENARLNDRVGLLAVSEERARIGMDLHDGVIQSIYAVGLTLETVSLVLESDPERARSLLEGAVGGLNDAIRDIRNFILDLRPRRFEGDLAKGLARLMREFQANTMVEVTLDADEALMAQLPGPIGQAIFLTTQEALANIARHARANRVSIKVVSEGGGVRLTVQDDGRGFEPGDETLAVGHGLANMNQRAADLQGAFSLTSAPGAGTSVTISLPFPER